MRTLPFGPLRRVNSHVRCSEGFVLYLDCGHNVVRDLVPGTSLARCSSCAPAGAAATTPTSHRPTPGERPAPTKIPSDPA